MKETCDGPLNLNIPYADKLLSLGVSGLVFAVDEDTVLKRSNGSANSAQDIAIEKRVFERVGHHPSIVRCLRMNSEGITLERMLYPLRKRLQDLHATNKTPSNTMILRWAQQITRGLAYIHSLGVMQADIGCHNILINKDNDVKLADFAGASVDGKKGNVYYETRSQKPGCNDVTVETEMFALGTTLYELSTASSPYPDLPSNTREIEKLYAAEHFPETESLLLGEVIKRCWAGGYSTVDDVRADVERRNIGSRGARHDHYGWSWGQTSSIFAARIPRFLSTQYVDDLPLFSGHSTPAYSLLFCVSYIQISIGMLSLASLSYMALRQTRVR